MSQCRAEHEHNHGSHDHGHDHDESWERGTEKSLFNFIDHDRIRALNAAHEDHVKQVFRAWDKRMENEPVAESDCDDQLLIHIPFNGSCKIKSIFLRFIDPAFAPQRLSLYVNAEELDFDSVGDATETQMFDLLGARHEPVEYMTRITKFSGVRHLSMLLSRKAPGPGSQESDLGVESRGDQPIKILYVGFKGEGVKLSKDPVITLYEAAPNPSDHPVAPDQLRQGKPVE